LAITFKDWKEYFKDYHIIRNTGVFSGRKYHHRSGSLPSCQNTEGWKGCMLWWNL